MDSCSLSTRRNRPRRALRPLTLAVGIAVITAGLAVGASPATAAGVTEGMVLTSSSITAGGTTSVSVFLFDPSGHPLDNITESTEITIAPDGSCYPDGDGKAYSCAATKAGSHIITANDSLSEDQVASAILTVTTGTITQLAIDPSEASITAGQTQAFTVTGVDDFGNTVDVTGASTFSISAPPGVYSYCDGPDCSAYAAGSYQVTAFYDNDAGGLSADATLMITTGPTVGIRFYGPLAGGPAGTGISGLRVNAYDANGYTTDVTSSTSFTMSIDGPCGGSRCVPTTAGPQQIIATYGSFTTSLSISIAAAKLDHVVLDPSTSSITAGGQQSYSVTGDDRFGNSVAVKPDAIFAISGGSCTHNACGATGAGPHTVTATAFDADHANNSNPVTGSATLTVTSGPAATLVPLSGSGQSATAGQAFAAPLAVTVTDQYGNGVPNATVLFTLTAGSAKFGSNTTATAVTDGSGVAKSPTLTAGTVAGPVTVTATAGSASGVFAETILATGPATADLAITMSAPATVKADVPFTLAATVTNNGPSAAGSMLTALAIPAGFTVTSTGGGSKIGSTVLFSLPSGLALHATKTYSITLTAIRKNAIGIFASVTISMTKDPKYLNNVAAVIIRTS